MPHTQDDLLGESASDAQPPSLSVHPYQRLTPERVLDAVESVGIRTDARILALNSYENRVYQVGVEDGPPVIVKFYRPQRWTREQILEEHAFATELADLEIPVAKRRYTISTASPSPFSSVWLVVRPIWMIPIIWSCSGASSVACISWGRRAPSSIAAG